MQDRAYHTQQLNRWFRHHAFHDDQWRVIEQLLDQNRILFIARTGFGKSLCFQYVAMARPGTTIVFSPLISLMRDQVNRLNQLGIEAATINSSLDGDEGAVVLGQLQSGKIKILYIAPEQIDGKSWGQILSYLGQGRMINQVVIDEAHCISVWGHDFRPKYRRILSLVLKLPDSCPVLACTATATEEVELDVKEQMAFKSLNIRTTLIRENLLQGVIKTNDPESKILILTKFLLDRPGQSGIVYAGTKTQVDLLAGYLNHCGIKSAGYHSGTEDRKGIEQNWLNNNYRVVVATSALGMGVDNLHVDFVIHFQVPQSLIHYYQEIGRAGRGGQASIALLILDETKDWRLVEGFAQNAKPKKEVYQAIFEALKQSPLSSVDLVKKLNCKKNTVESGLNDLMYQGLISKSGSQYLIVPPIRAIDFSMIEQDRYNKLKMLDDIKAYTAMRRGFAMHLAQYLGDKGSVSNAKDFDISPYISLVAQHTHPLLAEYEKYLDSLNPEIVFPPTSKAIISGRACGYYGESKWGRAVHQAKYGLSPGFPDFMAQRMAKIYRSRLSTGNFQLIVFVPPTKSGNIVRELAVSVGKILSLPVLDLVHKTRNTHVQKEMVSGFTKADNVKGAFVVSQPEIVQGKRVLIIDDVVDSGATIKEIGKVLIKAGAMGFSALALAQTAAQDD